MRGLRAWIFGALVVVVCVFVVAASQTFKQCVSNPEQQSAVQDSGHRSGDFFTVYWDCTGDFVRANSDGIIAAFTFILALSTIALWAATRDLVRGADETAKRQLRAYLGLKEAQVSQIPSRHMMVVTLYFINAGQTPAYNIRAKYEGRLIRANASIPDVPVMPNRKSGHATGPGQETLYQVPISLQSDEAVDIARQEMLICVFGRTEYEDAFGAHQWLTLKGTLGRDADNDWVLHPSEDGNESS